MQFSLLFLKNVDIIEKKPHQITYTKGFEERVL